MTHICKAGARHKAYITRPNYSYFHWMGILDENIGPDKIFLYLGQLKDLRQTLEPSYNRGVERVDLSQLFEGFYPTIYSLGFVLVPEPLQAEQICLDALDLLFISEKRDLSRLSRPPRPGWLLPSGNKLKRATSSTFGV